MRAHEFGFPFAHHAGIDVSAVNAVRTQRAQAQRVGDGGIDAAADEEEDVAPGGDLADVIFERTQLAGGVPVLGAAANVEQEVRKDGFAARRVRDFGMELDPVQAPRSRTHGRDGASGGGGQHLETVRRLDHQIAVAHPDLLAAGDAAERWNRRPVKSSCANPYSPLSPFCTEPCRRCAINCWP